MQTLQNIYYTLVIRLQNKDDKGQSTAEYSLVILGAAAIALLLLTWASGSGSIGNLFESVIAKVTSNV